MEKTLDAIYQAGAWVMIGIIALYGMLRNRYPSTLAAIQNWLGKFVKAEPEIVVVKYLGTETKPAKGSHRRIVLTNLLFGFMESLLVASMEGHDLYHRFAVYYDNGEIKIVDCMEGSEQYNALMNYVSWEDL